MDVQWIAHAMAAQGGGEATVSQRCPKAVEM